MTVKDCKTPETAVLISIRPEWCELIARGVKTLEVRKSCPKLETPFTCYIYQTKGGGVVAEFICDSISYYPMPKSLDDIKACRDFWSKALLKTSVIWEYSGGKKTLYGWHISELHVYKNPLDLSALSNLDGELVKRAPQSWQYVERKDGT